MGVVLWHIEISHYNEKARWALDYKGIPYELRTPMPGTHRLSALRLTRGRHDRLPVLGLGGSRIGDSTAIIAALEEHTPEPALYPADPVERERALELEDFFDEEVGPRVRRLYWFHTIDDVDAASEVILNNVGTLRRGVMRRLAPIAGRGVKRDYGIDEAGAAEAADGLRAAMDRLESEIGPSGYLVGDSFSVADLTGAAMFTSIIAPPERPYAAPLPPPLTEFREELEARPGGAWIADVYARHRGAPVPVA